MDDRVSVRICDRDVLKAAVESLDMRNESDLVRAAVLVFLAGTKHLTKSQVSVLIRIAELSPKRVAEAFAAATESAIEDLQPRTKPDR